MQRGAVPAVPAIKRACQASCTEPSHMQPRQRRQQPDSHTQLLLIQVQEAVPGEARGGGRGRQRPRRSCCRAAPCPHDGLLHGLQRRRLLQRLLRCECRLLLLGQLLLFLLLHACGECRPAPAGRRQEASVR
jgi:hypothetical protein